MILLNRISTALLFSLVLINGLSAQDTLKLKDVVIIGNRLQNFNTGHHVQKFDSVLIKDQEHLNLSDFLSRHSTIFVRNYGPGTLATTSIRGAGASHTAILWNGFNLQSPMNGQLDFALLPLSLIDHVELQKGGSGALFGSGSVGGTIHMNNSPHFNSKLTVRNRTSFGSFGHWQQGVNILYGNENYYGGIKLYYHQAENNFPFKNFAEYGNPEVRQRNNGLKQYGMLFQNHLKLNQRSNLQLHFWYQDNYRQIPPPITAGNNTSDQHDEFYRLTSEYQYVADKYELYVRSAYFNNTLIFHESNIGHQSHNFSQTLISETEAMFYLKRNIQLNTGLNHTYNDATAGGYAGNHPNQNRIAGFTSLKLLNNLQTLKGTLNVRKEIVDGKAVPLTPSLGIEYLLLNNYTINGNISRNYRIPTFNDLYWKGAGARGNPDLLPESGYSGELGISYNSAVADHHINFSTKAFMSLIDNWINWEQLNEIWMPRNIMQVKAGGLEASFSSMKHINDFSLKTSLNYSYTQSTVTGSSQKENIGMQLMHVPFHTGNARVELKYNSFGIAYAQTYTGSRFTNTDNTSLLPHFTLANMLLYKSVQFQAYELKLSAEANNLFNTDYQVIPFQAMPGRNYQLSINISFTKPKK